MKRNWKARTAMTALYIASQLLLTSADAGAMQQAAVTAVDPSANTPFAFAVTDEFPYGDADAVIVRRPGADVPDVILVRQGKVTPDLLGAAARHLAGVRAAHGDLPSGRAVIRVRDDGRHPWKRPRETALWMSWLMSKRAKQLNGVGTVQHLVLLMPNQWNGR